MANTSKKSLDINGLEYVASKVMTLVNSGGTADYLVEEGKTPSSWYYRKWASGIFEAWINTSVSVAMTNSINGMYYGNTEVPIGEFNLIQIPNITVVGKASGAYFGTKIEPVSTASSIMLSSRASAQQTTTVVFNISLRGLWKEFTPDIMKTPSLDLYYPVGSIYQTSNANFDPNITFGGTWELITNKFLIGAGDEYENGEEGGSTEHTHKYGVMYHTYFYTVQMEGNQGGVLTMENGSETTLGTETTVTTTDTVATNNANAASSKNVTAYAKSSIGYTGKESTIPPYKAVYMWERIA